MTSTQQFDLKINGEIHQVRADGAATLLEVLRQQMGLNGAKCGCNQGLCGACNVLLDGKAVRSCLVIAATAIDREIETIEGLEQNGELSPMQQAFLDTGAYSQDQLYAVNGRGRPKVLMIGEDGTPRVIRTADSFDDMLLNEVE